MMLFGLSRSPELNGRTVRVLGDGFPNEQGRIAVQIEVEPPRTILVQPQNWAIVPIQSWLSSSSAVQT